MIAATAVVPAPADALFALLADLEEHWRLAGGWVRALELEPDRGVVEVRGPLGLVRRRIHTRVVARVPGECVEGLAETRGTRAHVRWTLREIGPGATEVRLAAVVERGALLDRALLACGGARWLRRHFDATLARLGVEVARAAPRAMQGAVG